MFANANNSHYYASMASLPSAPLVTEREPLEDRSSRVPASAVPRISSDSLFGGPQQVEVEIEHRQQVYRLRRTSLGKLILTK